MVRKITEKSQEEIVGFILIVVLVTVIALVFLAINLKKPHEKLQSMEIESFIESLRKVSSDCYTSPEIRRDISELIVLCASKEECLSGNSCEMLNSSLKMILDKSFKPGPENPNKAYLFDAVNTDVNQSFMLIKEGNCTGAKSFSEALLRSDVEIRLEICN